MTGLGQVESVLAWMFLAYMLLTSGTYLFLNVVALQALVRYLHGHRPGDEEVLLTGDEPPITIIVPAYNEAATIVTSIRSLLQLAYSDYELVVVNDGSADDTLAVLIAAFDLVRFPHSGDPQLPTRPVRGVYASRSHHKLRVIDKENGGKADALNAGLNVSRCPLFCCVDADSILERYALLRAVQPFIEDPDTVACGGTVRIANGCKVVSGHLVQAGVPGHPLALFQYIEYLRSFLFGRLGCAWLDALLIISGAFGVLHKDTVVRVGGYRTDTVGEDMELIVRLHRVLSGEGRRYRISFIPDPICWTEVPESPRVFASQRMRWHRGLSESLWLNRSLLFSHGNAAVGWFAFPFFIVCEWASPLVEIAGYLFTAWLWATGQIDGEIALVILIFALSLSLLLSSTAYLLDEIAFQEKSGLRHVPVLLLFAVLECLGYRQWNAWLRLRGTWRWITGRRADWGRMTRSGRWQN